MSKSNYSHRIKLRYSTETPSKRGKAQDHSIDEALRAVKNTGTRIMKKNGQIYLVASTFHDIPDIVVGNTTKHNMTYKTTTLFPTKAHTKRISDTSFVEVYKELMREAMAQPPKKRKNPYSDITFGSSRATSVTKHSMEIDPATKKLRWTSVTTPIENV